MTAVTWLLLLAAVAAVVGARLGWEAHRGHALERVAWAIVGAVMAVSFVFVWPGSCLDQSNRDADDPARYPGRYRDL